MSRSRSVSCLVGLAVLVLASCASAPRGGSAADDLDHRNLTDALVVTSPAFGEGETIPTTYTCKGAGTSPPLEWQGVPTGTAALALVVDDPDAPGGTYVHWIVTGIDPASSRLDEGRVPAGAHQADSSAGKAAYRPPCPPSGEHHYRFTVYALSQAIAVSDGASTNDALKAIAGAATARGRIIGRVAA